jgi:F-type H+-transporting ATPase subunit b
MININWSTLLFQIFNFVVMVVILTRFFFKPVVRILDERAKRVTNALDEAERREKEAADAYAEYQEKLSQTQQQVAALRQQAQQDLDQARKSALGETREEIEKMRKQAELELGDARQKAIRQHQRDLGQLATTLSEKLMRDAGGEAFQRASIAQFVDQLAALAVDAYRAVLEDTESEVVHLQLNSARELDAGVRAQIETWVQEKTDKPVDIKYRIDANLIAGATMRLGDVVVDGSLAGQLQRLGERYTADLEQIQE